PDELHADRRRKRRIRVRSFTAIAPHAARSTPNHDPPAIERVGGLLIVCGLRAQALGPTLTICSDAVDVAAVDVAPRHICDVLAVRRPRRMKLADAVRCDETVWRSVRQVHDPQ